MSTGVVAGSATQKLGQKNRATAESCLFERLFDPRLKVEPHALSGLEGNSFCLSNVMRSMMTGSVFAGNANKMGEN
jgi:hypothetical protein